MMFVIFWLACAIAIGAWASTLNRNAFGWALLAAVITSVIATVALLIAIAPTKANVPFPTNDGGCTCGTVKVGNYCFPSYGDLSDPSCPAEPTNQRSDVPMPTPRPPTAGAQDAVAKPPER